MGGSLVGALAPRHDAVIGDLPAGLGHLQQGDPTMLGFSSLVVVVEPYLKSLDTAKRTAAVLREQPVIDLTVVANKVADSAEEDSVRRFCSSVGVRFLGSIPNDPDVRRADRGGVSLVDLSPAGAEIRALEGVLRTLVAGPRGS